MPHPRARRHCAPRRCSPTTALVALLAARAIAGCRGEARAPRAAAPAEPPVATPATSPPPAPRPAVADASDFIAQQIALRVPALRAPLVPVLPLVRGALPEGGAASHAFEMSAGHCYRVVAVGGVGADDLDLALYAPDGTLVESDERRDEDPVLGSTRPLCPPNGGSYRVEVRMVRGHGEYGVQVLGTP